MAVPVLSTALHRAFALAAEWHMADTRKGLWYHDAVLDIARSPLNGTRVVQQLEFVMAELYRGTGLARSQPGGVPMEPPLRDSDEAPL